MDLHSASGDFDISIPLPQSLLQKATQKVAHSIVYSAKSLQAQLQLRNADISSER